MTEWWRDPASLEAAIQEYGTPTNAANSKGGASPSTVQRAWNAVKRGQLPAQNVASAARARYSGTAPTVDSAPTRTRSKAATTQGDGESELVVTLPNHLGTDTRRPEDVVRDTTGTNPDEWLIDWRKNQWDVNTGRNKAGVVELATMHQLTVRAQRRPEYLAPNQAPFGWTPPIAAAPARDHGQPWLIPIFSDPHAPNFQPELVEASVRWLEDFQPERVWCLGDAANNSPFGRHGLNPRVDCDPKTALWATTELLARWTNAAPAAVRTVLFGNHDHWLAKRLLEMYPNAMKLVRWNEEKPHLSFSTLLRLDDIGWGYHETDGEYHDVNIELVPDLVGMHGTRTGKQGGAIKEIERWEGVSIVQGHDHKLGFDAVRYRSARDGNVQRYAICAGSLANADLGYDPAQNVGQGWPVLTLWPDGRWGVDFALYDPVTKSTTWRDWRYDAA